MIDDNLMTSGRILGNNNMVAQDIHAENTSVISDQVVDLELKRDIASGHPVVMHSLIKYIHTAPNSVEIHHDNF